jgi:Gpi18-like mannosyltransferase
MLIGLFNFLPRGSLDLNIYVDPSYFYTGMFLSIMFFIPALYLLSKLWQEEYTPKVANTSILLLLSFPAAFYFGSIYSEALFLLLTVLVFWFVRKDKFILAGIFAALASATKIQGILLFVYLGIELWNKDKRTWREWIGIFISPLGLITYMLYLKHSMGDPFYFLTSQPLFGAGRSSLPLVLLPQVAYRYIKIFLSVKIMSLAFFNAFLEFVMMLILVAELIWSFKKIRFSYWSFVALAVIMPTLTGTFSSMPRYALLAFPLLPLIAKYKRASKYIIIAQSLVQIVLLALFIRGYWVA